MPDFTILADDLSGAADCGVQATRWGMRTVVRLTPPGKVSAAGPDCEALSWDLDSRILDVKTAYRRTYDAARDTGRHGHVYVKLDSSLRGHVGAALDAALAATGAELAIFAPALPEQGRVTIDGRHCVRGAPAVDLARFVRAQSGTPVVELGLASIRSGDSARMVAARENQGPLIVVCDAENSEDFRILAGSLLDPFPRAIWAGSDALASALVEVVSGPTAHQSYETVRDSGGPVLVVAGSTAVETREQVANILGEDRASLVSIPSEALTESGPYAGSESVQVAGRVASALGSGSDVVLQVAGEANDVARPRIAGVLGAIVKEVSDISAPGGLVLTGGETARAVCDALGVVQLELIGEVEAGVPLAISSVPRGRGDEASRSMASVPVVTKAGAFGGPDVLELACDALHGRTP